jgi:phenylpropionate dioxygenase-like ring-hydroxylating dioxygenase large terminal subunit
MWKKLILLALVMSSADSFWFPIIHKTQLDSKKIHHVKFLNEPYVCYKNKNQTYILHTDICPHMGASLSKTGWINKDGNIQCGYHGFEFCNGNFCKIPNPQKNPKYFTSKINLDLYPTIAKNDFLFFKPYQFDLTPDIFYPAEEYDKNFIGIDGIRMINNNFMSVCENLLDMLHISYVHSFGSRMTPIPIDIKSKRLGNFSFQSQFFYAPSKNTISYQMGNSSNVIVQNEYHLPTNTITRVFAGDVIKTVFTRTIPINDNLSLLYWKIYRNFWIDPFFAIFNNIGDFLLRFLMEKTIDEDAKILRNVYDNRRIGNLTTKYDVTINNFRKDYDKYINKI